MAELGSAVVGRRVIVTGLAGSGKSTFSRSLAEATGLPLIHLDLEFWKPGWTAPTDEEWQAKQREVLAADEWIADGNYHETLPLRLDRADTVVVLDMPWQLCFVRAVGRSLKSSGGQMPEGCEDSAWRRLKDELGVAGRVWRKRRWEPALERDLIAEHGGHATVHILRSKADVAALLDGVRAG